MLADRVSVPQSAPTCSTRSPRRLSGGGCVMPPESPNASLICSRVRSSSPGMKWTWARGVTVEDACPSTADTCSRDARRDSRVDAV